MDVFVLPLVSMMMVFMVTMSVFAITSCYLLVSKLDRFSRRVDIFA